MRKLQTGFTFSILLLGLASCGGTAADPCSSETCQLRIVNNTDTDFVDLVRADYACGLFVWTNWAPGGNAGGGTMDEPWPAGVADFNFVTAKGIASVYPDVVLPAGGTQELELN